MGEAKMKRAGVASVKDVAITKREQWFAAMLLINRESDSMDRRKVRTALAELGASDLAETMMDGAVTMPTGRDGLAPLIVGLTDGTITFLIKTMEKPLGGAQGYILGAMEEKLTRLRDGNYRLPAEIPDGQDEPS